MTGDVAYSIPAAPTSHVVADLAPGGRYGVSVTAGPGGTLLVHVTTGGDRTASAAGVLRFSTTDAAR